MDFFPSPLANKPRYVAGWGPSGLSSHFLPCTCLSAMETTAKKKKKRERMISPRRKQIPRLLGGEFEFAIADSARGGTSAEVHPPFDLIPTSRTEFSGLAVLHFAIFFWHTRHLWRH